MIKLEMMRTKYIWAYIWINMLMVMGLFSVSSCTDGGVETGEGDGDAYINLVLSSRSGALPTPAEDGEKGIRSLRVFIYNTAGQLEFTQRYTASGDSRIENPVIKVLPGVKDVYVIVNEDAVGVNATDLGTKLSAVSALGSTADGLKALLVKYNSFPQLSTEGLLMAGVALNQLVPEGKTRTNPQKVTVEVIRNCARLDVKIRKKKASVQLVVKELALVNGCDLQMLFEPATLPSGAGYALARTVNMDDRSVTVTDPDFQDLGTYYLPENLHGQTDASKGSYLQLSYTLNGTDHVDKMMINEGEGKTITRNTKYTLSVTVDAEVEFDLLIEDWDDKSVEGDIAGMDLVIPGKVVMDWWNLGRSFSTSVDYSASEKVSFVGYQYGTDEIRTDGANLPAWLPLANITGIPNGSATNGTIRLTYKIDGAANKSSVYLWFKAGNTNKRMEVVYDNGYIPESMLPAKWTFNRPAEGLHLAKCGESKYPGSVATEGDGNWEKWASNNDLYPNPSLAGFGYGLYNTNSWVELNDLTATPAAFYYSATYCHNMGEEWFTPSLDELKFLMDDNNYFGPSYTFRSGYNYASSTCMANNDGFLNFYVYNTNSGQINYTLASRISYTRCVTMLNQLYIDKVYLVADYAAWGNSFTKEVNFKSSGGAVRVLTIDNGGSRKNWLTSAVVHGTEEGSIAVTYTPTPGDNGVHEDVAIRLETAGGEIKEIIVKYDNGYITNNYLRAYGWTTNLPRTGIQLSKRGAVHPTGTAHPAERKLRNYASYVTIPGLIEPAIMEAQPTAGMACDIDVLLGWIDPKPTFGNGYSNTQILKGYPQCNMIPYCEALGPDWYIPSVGEVCVIGKNNNLLGDSYTLSFMPSGDTIYTLTSSFSWISNAGGYGVYLQLSYNCIYDALTTEGHIRPVANW